MRLLAQGDPAPAELHGRDLVVFSNDWDGDPLSKTHIMRILARRNRILWVNSLGNRAPRANAHDVRRALKRITSFSRGVREVEKNLHVLSPLALPLYGSTLARVANRILLRAQLLRAMRTLRFTRPITWSFLPSAAPVCGTLGERLVVYQCVDEFSAFADTNGAQIASLERELLEKADLVITSAHRLSESKRRVNPNTVLVRHGVDFGHFVKACDSDTKVPGELASLGKPVLGFFGLVADWVDQDALIASAKAFPQGSVVVLGKVAPNVSVGELEKLQNIHLLGQKKYSELPEYCRGFDVALMPFKTNELTLNANPLKVREYLAAGLPVVSSDLPEVKRLGLCRIARSPEEFPQRVAECLQEGAGPSRARALLVSDESWEARVREIEQHVSQALLGTRSNARRS